MSRQPQQWSGTVHVADILRDRNREVVSIAAGLSIRDAAKVLTTNRIGAAIVRNQAGEMIGIVSERDLTRWIAETGAQDIETPIEVLMTRTVITCESEQGLRQVMKLMIDNEVRHLPVTEGGEPVAMISIRDIVRGHVEAIESENSELRKLLVALK